MDDFYAGGTLPDSRGLKHFPRLWCGNASHSSCFCLFLPQGMPAWVTEKGQWKRACTCGTYYFICNHRSQRAFSYYALQVQGGGV